MRHIFPACAHTHTLCKSHKRKNHIPSFSLKKAAVRTDAAPTNMRSSPKTQTTQTLLNQGSSPPWAHPQTPTFRASRLPFSSPSFASTYLLPLPLSVSPARHFCHPNNTLFTAVLELFSYYPRALSLGRIWLSDRYYLLAAIHLPLSALVQMDRPIPRPHHNRLPAAIHLPQNLRRAERPLHHHRYSQTDPPVMRTRI